MRTTNPKRKAKTTRRKRGVAAVRAAKAAIDIFDNDHDHDVDAKDVKRLKAASKKKNPLITDFAQLMNGAVAAYQLNEMMNKKKPVRRKKSTAKRRRNPETQAQINARMAKVRAARTVSGKQGAVSSKKNPTANRSRITTNTKTPRRELNVLTIGNPDKISAVFVYGEGVDKRFATMKAARAWATRSKVKLLENPKPIAVGSVRKAVSSKKRNPVAKKTVTTKKKVNPVVTKKAVAKKVNPVKKTTANRSRLTANPKTTARRRTFEMFNGRPATQVKPLEVSRLAGKGVRMDQLGDLVEIHLDNGAVIKTNPVKFKLCVSRGRLWIAGGKFHAGEMPTRKINPIAKLHAVVYRTHKPHHGDPKGQHYIHEMGEWSGNKPTFAIDNEGYPVIRGGSYKIEARGIVD